MALCEAELRHLADELRERLVGVPLSNSWQPTRDRVLLLFADGTRLLMVPRGPDARIHTVRQRPKNPQKPFSFQGAMRAHLQGRLEAVDKHPNDRAVDLHFTQGTLHLRLTGNSGGLWLSRDGGIVAAYDGPAPPTLPALPEYGARAVPPRVTPRPGDTWNDTIARFYAARIRQRRLNELRIVVGRALRKEVKRLVRLERNLEGDLDKADKADVVRECADVLGANLHKVQQGPDHVLLVALDDPERTIRVPLQPALSPARSMDALYKKARRLDRMGESVLERLEAASIALRNSRRQLDEVDTLTLEELERLHKGSTKTAPIQRKQISGVTRWTGPRNEMVWVGRNVKANRKLSFQVGRAHDFWMHIRSRAGAHILLPMQRGHTPDLDHLLAAAQIAAVHAKIPVGGKLEVQYTRVRDIRSIPGPNHASVRVFNEKVLHIVRDPDGLTGWTRELEPS